MLELNLFWNAQQYFTREPPDAMESFPAPIRQ